MQDATFKAYGGSGYTHSAGGALLEPNDFHGMAALLVHGRGMHEHDSASDNRKRRAALKRLMDICHGNKVVQKALTCLERELEGAQPTLHESDLDDSDVSDEEAAPPAAATLCNEAAISGAITSTLPMGPGADAQRNHAEATVGDSERRATGKVQKVAAESADALAFTTLFPRGEGGFQNTSNGCSRRHYTQKMLGSIATPFRKAQDFLWYHFQSGVKRSLQQAGPRMVNGHVVMNADEAALDEQHQDLQQQWEHLKQSAPEYVPHCTFRETFTGSVGKQVVGSKAYWYGPGGERFGPPLNGRLIARRAGGAVSRLALWNRTSRPMAASPCRL